MAEKIYTVSEITEEIKILLESNFFSLWVKGEVSNFNRHHSGHFYFSLKDKSAQIQCVMWRNKNIRLSFLLEDGMEVLARGRITVYEKSGKYQLEVDEIQPLGIGELQLAFEQLKRKLQEEGLFDQKFKKPLPVFPFRVGIVTSPTGAAVRDLISIMKRRFPPVEIILNPVRVQGEGAAEDIVRALREFNEWGEVDLIIVGRGGGSLEDLWAFNEEIVARAIFDSKIPVISAVGHEIDFSISDFVADKRAATPSAAAEIAVMDYRDIDSTLNNILKRLYMKMKSNFEQERERLKRIESNYYFRKPVDMIKQFSQQIDEVFNKLEKNFEFLIESNTNLLLQLEKRLSSLDPEKVLQRGYSICYKNGEVVKNSAQVEPLDTVQVKLAKGHFISQVQMIGEGQ